MMMMIMMMMAMMIMTVISGSSVRHLTTPMEGLSFDIATATVPAATKTGTRPTPPPVKPPPPLTLPPPPPPVNMMTTSIISRLVTTMQLQNSKTVTLLKSKQKLLFLMTMMMFVKSNLCRFSSRSNSANKDAFLEHYLPPPSYFQNCCLIVSTSTSIRIRITDWQ